MAMLGGCAMSGGDVRCPDGAGGSFWSARLGVQVEVAVPVCMAGTATATSDPSSGVAALGRTLGIIERLVTPGAN